VSDYSRYLPADVKVASTFWTTYLGSALGSSLSFIFGAVAVLAIRWAWTPWTRSSSPPAPSAR
jgi:purine-cytosine permease-like protein